MVQIPKAADETQTWVPHPWRSFIAARVAGREPQPPALSLRTEYRILINAYAQDAPILDAVFCGKNGQAFPPEYFFRHFSRLIPPLAHNSK